MNLSVQLDAIEARVFGVLIEKALTTPDQYPLSLNATTLGVNQKTNRDPVLALEETGVAAALDRLVKKYLARNVFPANSRVEKYTHNGKDALGLSGAEQAIIAELLLRGPQMPGELRMRASRMIPIESLDQLLSLLGPLIERGFIRRLAPTPGARAERYVQLISPDLHPLDAAPVDDERSVGSGPSLAERVAALEAEVKGLRDAVEALTRRLEITDVPGPVT